MQAFNDVLDTGTLPNPLSDAQLLAGYPQIDELIYLSLGETWIPPAAGLINALQKIPAYAHGYTLSPYGLPMLRKTLREYIQRSHQLPETSNYDVAVSQAGTRSAMSDFAQLLLAHYNKPCAVLVPEPGWDYAGVFEPLGFNIHYYHLTADNNWQPNPEQIIQAMQPNALLVLNAQHNPTATEWSPQIVSQLIAAALERNTAILIDDAYYALHSPDHNPTNALGILIEQIDSSAATPWLAVRTMGKQFRCNGWGIGALTAHPKTLTHLAEITHQHSYGSAIPLQAAMAMWLQDPTSDEYLEQIRHHYSNARNNVTELLTDTLGFPSDAVCTGTCTSYMRFQIPPRFIQQADQESYRRLCLDAGVLPGHGSMTTNQPRPDQTYARIHLGHPIPILEQAIKRLHSAGLGW